MTTFMHNMGIIIIAAACIGIVYGVIRFMTGRNVPSDQPKEDKKVPKKPSDNGLAEAAFTEEPIFDDPISENGNNEAAGKAAVHSSVNKNRWIEREKCKITNKFTVSYAVYYKNDRKKFGTIKKVPTVFGMSDDHSDIVMGSSDAIGRQHFAICEAEGRIRIVGCPALESKDPEAGRTLLVRQNDEMFKADSLTLGEGITDVCVGDYFVRITVVSGKNGEAKRHTMSIDELERQMKSDRSDKESQQGRPQEPEPYERPVKKAEKVLSRKPKEVPEDIPEQETPEQEIPERKTSEQPVGKTKLVDEPKEEKVSKKRRETTNSIGF
ncbi:MAG: hypothetical protein EOM18_00630 [Clostridia bacterium]|nr:hypothetical protein [Clostridia bacterium]